MESILMHKWTLNEKALFIKSTFCLLKSIFFKLKVPCGIMKSMLPKAFKLKNTIPIELYFLINTSLVTLKAPCDHDEKCI